MNSRAAHPPALELKQLAVARIALHRGEIHKALRLLRRTFAAAEEAERTRGVVQTLVLQPLAHQAQGDEDQPMASLERALILAEPEDSVRTFLDEGLFMAELLRIALSEGVVPVTPLASSLLSTRSLT